MQLRPLFTGAAGSPLTATILSSLVATIIPQPVPQKRHTDLSHLQPLSASLCAACSPIGMDIPTAVATDAAAEFFKNSRLVVLIIFILKFLNKILFLVFC